MKTKKLDLELKESIAEYFGVSVRFVNMSISSQRNSEKALQIKKRYKQERSRIQKTIKTA